MEKYGKVKNAQEVSGKRNSGLSLGAGADLRQLGAGQSLAFAVPQVQLPAGELADCPC